MKLSISIGSIIYGFMQLVFTVCQIEDYRNILKLSCRLLAFISNKAVLKTKRGLPLVSLPHFLDDFWRKIFLLLYSITLPNVIVWLSLPREILHNMCIVTVSQPCCDVKNFEINLIFLIRAIFSLWSKSQHKI